MGLFFKKEDNSQRKLLEFSDDVALLKREMTDIRIRMEALEIKNLEMLKKYKQKLLPLEETKDINTGNNILLPER